MSEIQTTNWDSTAASNNTTPPDGWPEGQAPSTVNDCAREMMAAVKRWFTRVVGLTDAGVLIASAGTSTAITVTYDVAPASLYTGLECAFKVTTTCGAAPTLDVNSLGAKNIQKIVGLNYVNLDAGDIAATQHVKVKYDGTLDKWVLLTAPTIGSQSLSGFTNLVDNGDGIVSQDGSTINGLADNANGVDRWRVLSNGSTVNVFSSQTGLPAGAESRMAVQTVGANVKFGIFHVVPNKRVQRLRSRTITLSGQLIVNNARMGNMKVGIAEWTSTADGATADPISAWNADGTTPTLAANWAFLNTPANLSVGTSFATITPVTVTVGASAANLAVIIWNDDTSVNASDSFDASNIMLNEGSGALPYELRPFPLAMQLCRAHHLVLGGESANDPIGSGYNRSTTVHRCFIPFQVKMNIAPTGITVANAANFVVVHAATTTAVTGITFVEATSNGVFVDATVAAGLTTGQGSLLKAANTNCRITVTGAEL